MASDGLLQQISLT